MLVFKAFSALLSYPTEGMREALPEIADAISRSPLVGPRERADLLDLIAEIGQGDLFAAEERYVDLFDRGRALSLHLFEHLHGDSRDRGGRGARCRILPRGGGSTRDPCHACRR